MGSLGVKQVEDSHDDVKLERLNFNVAPKVATEIRQLAIELNMSMTQLFKFAMSIIKIAHVEGRQKRKLVIADENGVVVREFIIPGLGNQEL